MVRVHDVVTELELDVLDRAVVEVLQQLLFDGFFGDDVLLAKLRLQVSIDEIDLL
jgi:hypothetical protein